MELDASGVVCPQSAAVVGQCLAELEAGEELVVTGDYPRPSGASAGLATDTSSGCRRNRRPGALHRTEVWLIVNTGLTVNGTRTTVETGESDNLAEAIWAAGYKRVKCGCDSDVCGASKVIVDGEARMARGMSAREASGSEVETVGSLGTQDDLHRYSSCSSTALPSSVASAFRA